jgi:peptidyl-prolyl cis-trans isomerase SurA
MRITLSIAALVAVSLSLAACAGTVRTTTAPSQSQDVVAEIAGTPITLDEFERRYARSAGGRASAADDAQADYIDFLNRYVDFRLKVMAGKEAGLHEVPEVAEEIETYRNNFARPYLLEQEVIEPLVRDVYERQQSIIRARHILIRVDEAASPADTLQAYDKLGAIADSIRAGADFGEMATRYSEDPSARRPAGEPGSGGDLGFFSTGMMVEPFETYAYGTEVGEMSPVFRTNFGYHILQVQDRRETPDPIRVSHLMIDPAGYTDASVPVTEFVETLRQRAIAGEDFAALVEEYSDDMSTRPRGGDLGFIEYTSRIIPSFIEGAFSIENVGDVSEIVETPFGYHIIKLMDRQARPTLEESYADLKQRVARMPRAQEAEQALARSIRADLGESVDLAPALQHVGDRSPQMAIAYLASDTLDSTARQTEVATLGTHSITIGDLGTFLRANPRYTSGDVRHRLNRAIDDLLSERAIELEARNLEHTDAEFAALMREFEDGLILFRFMEDSIWTAAARDSAAIEAIYNENPERFRFPDRSRVITVSARTDSLMQAFTGRFDELGDVAASLEWARDVEGVRVDTTYIAERTESNFDKALDLPHGQRTEPMRERGMRVVMIHDGIDAARTKTLDEARPQIVSMYQDILEQQVMERLRDRFDVRLHPSRLANAFQSQDAELAAADSP